LHLGVLPILMCATMVIQMRQQPTPADPVQAKVIKFMPYLFLFMFASFPAGLVLYWICSNTLSILQQMIISRKYGSMKAK
jgi:YidC/Oxa1 family membrane protein insertase